MIRFRGKKVWQSQDRRGENEKTAGKVKSEPLNETKFRAASGRTRRIPDSNGNIP
jgi:hypothetical protein